MFNPFLFLDMYVQPLIVLRYECSSPYCSKICMVNPLLFPDNMYGQPLIVPDMYDQPLTVPDIYNQPLTVPDMYVRPLIVPRYVCSTPYCSQICMFYPLLFPDMYGQPHIVPRYV